MITRKKNKRRGDVMDPGAQHAVADGWHRERLWLVSDAKRSPKEEYHIKSRDTHAIVVLPSLLVVCWPSSIPVHSIKLAGGYKHWSGTLRHQTRHTHIHTQILQNARHSSGQIVETNAHNKTKDNQRSLPSPLGYSLVNYYVSSTIPLFPVLSITVCVCVCVFEGVPTR